MKNIMKKLRSNRGESLVEVLCAILIFTLSSVLMYSMVMAANDINATAKKADDEHQAQMEIAEKAEGAGVPGTVAMTVKDTAGNSITTIVNVKIYGTGVTSSGVSDGLYSYFKAEEAGGGT